MEGVLDERGGAGYFDSRVARFVPMIPSKYGIVSLSSGYCGNRCNVRVALVKLG